MVALVRRAASSTGTIAYGAFGAVGTSVVGTLATQKAGAAASSAGATARQAGGAGKKIKLSFLESFKASGGNALFFVGCDCGTAGCVIFDQGREKVCRPVKQQKTGTGTPV